MNPECPGSPGGSPGPVLLIASLLNSEAAREFLAAFTFWDAKRPITVEVLRRLSLSALAGHLGMEQMLTRLPGSWRREGCGGQGD